MRFENLSSYVYLSKLFSISFSPKKNSIYIYIPKLLPLLLLEISVFSLSFSFSLYFLFSSSHSSHTCNIFSCFFLSLNSEKRNKGFVIDTVAALTNYIIKKTQKPIHGTSKENKKKKEKEQLYTKRKKGVNLT